MARTKPPKVGDLRYAITRRLALWLHCEACRHAARLDPLALAVAHGETLPLQRLLERARCSACGSRNVDLQIPPDIGPGGQRRDP